MEGAICVIISGHWRGSAGGLKREGVAKRRVVPQNYDTRNTRLVLTNLEQTSEEVKFFQGRE